MTTQTRKTKTYQRRQRRTTTATTNNFHNYTMTSVSPLPTANPTTGKTHVAEVTKYHEGGTLKPYSHEESVGPKGTSVDVSSSFKFNYCIVLHCVV